MNEVKGKNALALSRDLGMSHKACWVLLHKVREAMAEEFKGRKLGGEGKVAEVDGAYFGGYVRPANHAENRRDRRKLANQIGQAPVRHHRARAQRQQPPRRVQVGRRGAGMDQVAPRPRARWSTPMKRQAGMALESKYEMKRINHQEAYSQDGACTNHGGKLFFSRLRRGEMGHFHHVSGPYLLRYAQEASWREDARRVDNGAQVRRVAELALHRGPSVDFAGYYQRHVKAA